LEGGKKIVVKGENRFQILEKEKELIGYWQGNISTFKDKPEKDKEKLTKLHSLLEGILMEDVGKQRFRELQDEGAIAKSDDITKFSFWVSQMIECPPEKKIELLVTNSTSKRIEILLEMLKILKLNRKENKM
jgi:Lon protease-like protein